MKYKPLGQSGIEASIVGLGGTSFGGYQEAGPPDDKQSINAIHSALDHGITLIDTAPSYGWGHSEHIVGKAINGRRDKVLSRQNVAYGGKISVVHQMVLKTVKRSL